uniref:Uncharacterized protein n=1 Tax=Aquila chrysaetos chrysaetos TaxID=223781 RepID=A0A663DJT7_AQUCH
SCSIFHTLEQGKARNSARVSFLYPAWGRGSLVWSAVRRGVGLALPGKPSARLLAAEEQSSSGISCYELEGKRVEIFLQGIWIAPGNHTGPVSLLETYFFSPVWVGVELFQEGRQE